MLALLALCLTPSALAAYGDDFGLVPGSFYAGTCDLPLVDGTEPMSDPGAPPLRPPSWAEAVEKRDCHRESTLVPQTAEPVTQAGAHPEGTATFELSPIDEPGTSGPYPDGNLKDAIVDLPKGFVGNPQAAPACPGDLFTVTGCPVESQVGVAEIRLSTSPTPTGNNPFCGLRQPSANSFFSPFFPQFSFPDGPVTQIGGGFISGATGLGARCRVPVYNLKPGYGEVAQFGFNIHPGIAISVRPEVMTEEDFRVQLQSVNTPMTPAVNKVTVTLWGVPGDSVHDPFRFRPVGDGGPEPELAPGQPWPSSVPIRPFVANPTECGDAPVTEITVSSWQERDTKLSYTDQAPAVTDCADVPFEPDITLAPTVSSADSPTGLDVELKIPQEGWEDEDVLATAHLKDTVVTLPPGVSVNPSGARGLEGCSDAGIGIRGVDGARYLFNNGDPFNKDGGADGAECPAGSRIGTAEVETPLLDETLTGEVVLGQPKDTDPQSGNMFRLFIVVRNEERGLIAKIFGSAKAHPASGRLTTTFRENPELPFNRLSLAFKGGPRGLLANPPRCGQPGWTSVFTPWSAAHGAGGQDVTDTGTFGIDASCAFGFAPTMVAGMSTQQARESGTFSFRFSREEGEQPLRGLTANLPTGLLASVKHVALCSDAQANAGTCPLASQIGIVGARAGSGDPFVLEQPGRIYLTEGYRGGEYGLAVKIRPTAGPFRGAMELSPIIVRQAIHVDRKTAQVTAVSDPFPLIHHGVPLRVREVLVNVDRPNFMLNPSDCSPKQVQATILSAEGTPVGVANHFQAANCADLRFKPRLSLALKGRRQVRTGKHPAIRAVVRQQGISEAGIAKAEVRLPKSLALDVNNAQELCEFEDGTKPDLENHCPKGSIVGRARAKTPLLNDDLVGNVYFVKNVRIDKDTGNEIRTLPMIVVALRGEIAVNLVGESDTTRSGKLVNTFDNVPDAPITRFNLNIAGGKNGILAVTRTRRSRINLCKRPNRHIAEADMDGQNGKRHDFNVRMNTPCGKKRRSAAKVCRKRTNNKQAFKRCVTKVKRNRAQAKRKAIKKKAAKQKASRS